MALLRVFQHDHVRGTTSNEPHTNLQDLWSRNSTRSRMKPSEKTLETERRQIHMLRLNHVRQCYTSVILVFPARNMQRGTADSTYIIKGPRFAIPILC